MSIDCALGFFLVVVSHPRTCQAKSSINFLSRNQCQPRHELSVTTNLLGKLADFFLGHEFVSISSLSHLAGGIVANVWLCGVAGIRSANK